MKDYKLIEKIWLAIRLKMAGKSLKTYDEIRRHEERKGVRSFEAWHVIGNKWILISELLRVSDDYTAIHFYDVDALMIFVKIDPHVLDIVAEALAENGELI